MRSILHVIYQIVGRLFNVSRHNAKTKEMTSVIIDLQHADDGASIAHTAEEFQTRYKKSMTFHKYQKNQDNLPTHSRQQ